MHSYCIHKDHEEKKGLNAWQDPKSSLEYLDVGLCSCENSPFFLYETQFYGPPWIHATIGGRERGKVCVYIMDAPKINKTDNNT